MNTMQQTVSGPDVLGALRELVRRMDPIASIYLGPPADPSDDRAEELSLRVRLAVGELERQGADEPTVQVVRNRLRSLGSTEGYALFAANGEILFARILPGVVRTDQVRFAAPAVVVPVLAWLARHPAYVLVVTDRQGADITQVPAGGAPGRTWTVVGPDDEIERNAPGGWSQPRYQRRAEDSWRHNAGSVAEEALRAVSEVHGDILFVAGDVRAVQLFGERVRDSDVFRHHLPGGRSPDGSATVRDAALAAALTERSTRVTHDVLRRLTEAFGPHGVAVEGAAATLAALCAGRAATLVVAGGATGRAWFGEDLLGSDLRPAAVVATQGDLIDVAVRAALLTDAQVVVLPEGPDPSYPAEGIGALCRYSA